MILLALRISLWLLLALGVLSCLLTLAGWFGPPAWPWDVANHFVPCYFALQVVVLFLIILSAGVTKGFRRPNWGVGLLALLIVACATLNGMRMAPFYLQAEGKAQASPTSQSTQLRSFKILHINVLGPNRNSAAVIQLIRQTRPDILTLAEYNGWWQNELKRSGVLDGFTSRYVVPYGNDGVYSRIPFQDVHVEFMATGRDPTTIAHFRWNGAPVTLLMVHPRPPVKPDWFLRQQRHFAKWEQDFPQYGENVLVVGDLNTSPWSAAFRHFSDTSGLRDSQLGYGVQPTWPTFWPRPWLRLPVALIPIDHVLLSRNFKVLSQKTGAFTGSDHWPIIVELALQPAQAARKTDTSH